MPTILCVNPGSNSLKFDLVQTQSSQSRAGEGHRILTGVIDDIGKDTSLVIKRGDEQILNKKLSGGDFNAAMKAVLEALDHQDLSKPELAAVRVVHGGDSFQQAVEVDEDVLQKIEVRAELAPLHNPNAARVIRAIQQHRMNLPIAAAFDTAFHHSVPEVAWRYPLDLEIADRHNIRKFGFHGISHRYQLDQFCYLTGTPIEEASLITTHLESGSSVCAIRNGKSVETSMGFTPLEGLMMGTRSGSVDPFIVPFLMKHERLSADEAIHLLESKSGLLGISGQSLDTRVLRKNTDARSQLALEMYAYRVRANIGAYLAILGDAKAIVFAGGIGENTPEIRRYVLEGLHGLGVEVDAHRNEDVMTGDTLLSSPNSKTAVWVLHSDEGLQLAHECSRIFSGTT
ncbi:acetate/propionate family kinase [Acidicapsa ligni]|uniref:acetate/propionate family kinase n=1 Tax=Acidicapsa ligni TaxID=542300 RepID=UPI0021E0BFF4|nr:acetate/propionate family kinase [Acidicapsa ligni]